MAVVPAQYTTVVTNISGATQYFAWLPPHGASLAAGGTYTVIGDLEDILMAQGAKNWDNTKYIQYCLATNPARSGGPLAAVTKTRAGQTLGAGSTSGLGTNGYDTTVAGLYKREVLNVAASAVAITSATGGWGTVPLYTFPNGLIDVRGAVINLAVTAGANIGATGTVNFALGTVASSSATALTGTTANILPSTAQALTASAATLKGVSTGALLGNWTTVSGNTGVANLNFFLNSTDCTGNSTLTLTGTVELLYGYIGNC